MKNKPVACGNALCDHVSITLHFENDGWGGPRDYPVRLCNLEDYAKHLMQTGRMTNLGWNDVLYDVRYKTLTEISK